MCRFGRETAPAHFLTQDAVLCFSPPMYGRNYMSSIKEKTLPLSVSNNAADFVFFGDYIYSSRIPSGAYQSGTEGSDTLLSCPMGAYCSSLLETNFTLCQPGTYQPNAGQGHCVQCPVGYVCNEFGMKLEHTPTNLVGATSVKLVSVHWFPQHGQHGHILRGRGVASSTPL